MYSYLKCIVSDKLLKHRQSFRITLYLKWSQINELRKRVIDAFISGYEPVSGCCEYNNWIAGSLSGKEIHQRLIDS